MKTEPNIELITRYFPDLTEIQKNQIAQLYSLYHEWNDQINVISRKDIDNLYEHHVLHSMGIAKILSFRPETHIMDLGTGGGFPGIPLAILFPECHFHLIDSIGKKIKVAQEISQAIGLTNVTLSHCNGIEVKEQYDFVVSRAVMETEKLIHIIRKNIHNKQRNSIPNGLICLKGGELDHELSGYKKRTTVWNLNSYFQEPFFDTKKVIHVSLI